MRLSGPVRVCFVIDRLSRAGTETQLVALLNNLDRRVVEPSLCLLNGRDSESQSLQPSNCPVIDLGLEHLASGAALPAASRLASFWRKQRTQIVQTYFLDSAYFAAPLARLTGIRHVVRVRNNAGYWLTRKHRVLGRILGRLGSTITNSDVARNAIQEVEQLRDADVTVIENGVDLDRFPLTSPPDTDRPGVRIGAVANLRQVKNVDGLIRAAETLTAKYPHSRFAIAGEGEQRSQLQVQIKKAGLDERFQLLGKVHDIPAFLASLDIAVLCSHSESMSNALLEYMAAGRAIVATDVGANASLARHEREGLIVPSRNDEALVAAIRRYLQQPDLAKRLGAAARGRAATDYSRGAMVRRFEMFFTKLARSKGSRFHREPRETICQSGQLVSPSSAA